MYHIVLYSHHTSKQNFMYLFISTIRVSNINVRPDEFGMWRERERERERELKVAPDGVKGDI